MSARIFRWYPPVFLGIAVVLLLGSASLLGQEPVSAPRADGHITPLLVYRPAGTGRGCAPLAIISHGAGGSETGYRYLARAMANSGYTTVVMGHRESGMAALRADVQVHGFWGGLEALVADPNAEKARLLDVGAALAWANGQCKATFRILLGHSMGSATVMLEAGARNVIGISSPPAGQDRFDAYVALSPEGPGVVFPEGAWSGIHKPVLILTGTRDQSLNKPGDRQIPWHDLPGEARSHCQWMGVIDGATHLNFAGIGFGAEHTDSDVTRTIANFLNGVGEKSCALPEPIKGMVLQAK